VLGLCVFGAFAALAHHARGGFSLNVAPIPIVISDGATSTMAELQNESDETIRVEAKAAEWTIDPTTGQDVTTPTGEILVFPSLVTIQPHTSRKVRIGTQGGYGPAEKCFRVTLAELPPDFTPLDGGALLKVVAHVSVPLFVRPPGVTGNLKVEQATATKDRIDVVIRNTGGAHAMAQTLRLASLGPGGIILARADVAGWYVLPGGTRPFHIDLASAGFNCKGAKQVSVTAESRDSPSSSAVIDNPACASP
jgi:fimbrial chaperone protein